MLALHADRPGVYNISGREVFPRSQLGNPVRRIAGIRLPDTLGSALAFLEQLTGGGDRASFDRYGIVPSSRLAHEALGFEPQYRIEVRGSGASRRIDTVRAR
jgi:nucleoside-diphosphate-sugar epimerase